jgi:hypothetical protein
MDKQTERNGECFMEIPEAAEFAQWVKAHEDAPAYEIYEALAAVANKHINLCVLATKLAKQMVGMDKMGAIELEQWPLAQQLVGLCED